jgi:hypothetical protein
MGANFEVVEFDGNLTRDQLTNKYQELVQDQKYEYGHGGYSGTFATLHGIAIKGGVFSSRKEAEDYIENNHQKRDPAMAVLFRNVEKTFEKRPTFNGKPMAVNGCWSPSKDAQPVEVRYYYPENASQDAPYSYRTKALAEVLNGEIKNVVADQLNAGDKEKLKATWNSFFEASSDWKSLHDKMEVLVNKLKKTEAVFTTEDWRDLKTVRKSLKRALCLREKTKAKFIALDKKLGERLYKYGENDKGDKWLVGGWCAS